MNDSELLLVAESVLADAVAEAEFTGRPKDVSYCQLVAEKVEKLRAKIGNRTPVQLTMMLVNHRMMVVYAISQPTFFREL